MFRARNGFPFETLVFLVPPFALPRSTAGFLDVLLGTRLYEEDSAVVNLQNHWDFQ